MCLCVCDNIARICRIWNLSVTCLTVLTIYNILLTLKLMYSPDCSKNIIQVQNPLEPPRNPCLDNIESFGKDASNPKLDLRLGRWDNSLTYKYFDNFWIGDSFPELSEEYSVCLATQGSVDKLYSLVDVADHWSGPISAAVFAAGDEELNILLLYLTYLRQCHVTIRDKINFHLAVPKGRMPKSIEVDMSQLSDMDCLRPEVELKQLLKRRSSATQKWRDKNVYPQNHLRNVARKNCQNKFVYLTDIDIIPSYKMADELNKFLQDPPCKNLCAYVIPTYELDERVLFPTNKTELVRLANKGLARPFHEKVFIYNQFATNFSRWQSVTNESPEIHVSHPVTNFEFLYEPFYIASDTAPAHDERFVGYGFTRNTQVYEMFVAGFEFVVLSPVFSCHWGLQLKRGRPPWREQQNAQNRKKLDLFKHEIYVKYGRDPLRMVDKSKNKKG